MDIFSVFLTNAHIAPLLTPPFLAGKFRTFAFSAKSSPDPDLSTNPVRHSGDVRRPKPLKNSPSKSIPQSPKISTNPLRNLVNPSKTRRNPDKITNKLWLSSKINPPPPPPPPTSVDEEQEDGEEEGEDETKVSGDEGFEPSPTPEFRQEGKIFVGNLPLWIKKNELAEFFRQFGPVKNVILIKGHEDPERNVGYGFVIYGGPTAVNTAVKAVELDGVEFHGRVLSVKLDDGRRLKTRAEERERWLAGSDEVEFRSKWHEERESSRRAFKKVVETEPENWQGVVRAFERIKKW